MIDLADWLRRQRAQQLVNFGLVRRADARSVARESVATAESDLPFSVVADAYVSLRPAILSLRLDRPYDILEESFTYPRHRHGMVKRFLRGDLRPGRARPLDSALCLAHYWADNYWHWVYDNLPKVLLAEQAGFAGVYLVPESGFARETLARLGVAPERILVHGESDLWRVARLWVSPRFEGESLVHRQALLARLRAGLMRGVAPPAERARLYVSRNRGSLARRIVNEPDFKALIARFGFRDYFPEDHSVAAQIGHFASCEALIGVHGASFTNELFMPEGALVVGLFAPSYIPSAHTIGAARLLRHRYYPLVSPVMEDPYPHGSDVAVDLDLVEMTLARELEAAPPPRAHG